ATWCIVSKSSLHSAILTATEPVHDHPTRRLQLRAASPYDRGRTIAHLHVPLPGMPTPHWRRDQQPGALPPRAGHLRRKVYGVDADSRKWQRADLSFLSDMRLHRLLGGRRLSWIRRRCHRQLRRPEFPSADHRGVGGGTPPLALLAPRYAAQARGEAGVKYPPAVFCQVSICFADDPENRRLSIESASPQSGRLKNESDPSS